jgi:hypothetical protein
LSQNMFTNLNARGPLTRATLGMALALAAIGAIGFGTGIAGAAPQQPFLVDDPVPIPAPVGTIFDKLGPLLNSLFPGSGSSTRPLSPGHPHTALPRQTPAVPYSPGAVLPDPASF